MMIVISYNVKIYIWIVYINNMSQMFMCIIFKYNDCIKVFI